MTKSSPLKNGTDPHVAIDNIFTKIFQLSRRNSLIENLNSLSLLLADRDYTLDIRNVLGLVHFPPVDSRHLERIMFKRVIASWIRGDISQFDPVAELESSRSMLAKMPWLKDVVIENSSAPAGPPPEYIQSLILEERARDPSRSTREIAKTVSKASNVDFWQIYPKALAIKKHLEHADTASPPVGRSGKRSKKT